MKHYYSFMVVPLSMIVAVGVLTAEADVAPAITLDRTTFFTAPDGNDIEVPSGTYRVERTGESNLRVVRVGGQAIEIPATKIPHQESVTASIAMAIVEEGQEDQVHLVLLLPRGEALDAVGSFSGVRSRATVATTLNPTQLQTAMVQVKVLPQKPAGNQAAFIRVPNQTRMDSLKLSSFVKIPGSLTKIAAGGAVYGLNAANELYMWNETQQEFFNFLDFYSAETPSTSLSHLTAKRMTFSQIAVGFGSVYNVWAIGGTNTVYSWAGQMVVPGPPLQQLIADRTFVWGIDGSHRVYRRRVDDADLAPFHQVQGTLVQIASYRGDGWGIDSAHRIYRCRCYTDSADASFQQVPGSLAQISVGYWGTDEEVWGVNDVNQIYRFNMKAERFDQVPGSLTSIAVGPDGIWGLNKAGEIYRFNKAKGAFDQVPGSLVQLALSSDGQGVGVWGINRSNEIFRFKEAP